MFHCTQTSLLLPAGLLFTHLLHLLTYVPVGWAQPRIFLSFHSLLAGTNQTNSGWVLPKRPHRPQENTVCLCPFRGGKHQQQKSKDLLRHYIVPQQKLICENNFSTFKHWIGHKANIKLRRIILLQLIPYDSLNKLDKSKIFQRRHRKCACNIQHHAHTLKEDLCNPRSNLKSLCYVTVRCTAVLALSQQGTPKDVKSIRLQSQLCSKNFIQRVPRTSAQCNHKPQNPLQFTLTK